MKRAPLTVLLAGALSLVGCPAPDAGVSPPTPAPPPPAAATEEPKPPEPAKVDEVAKLPEVTYYALSG